MQREVPGDPGAGTSSYWVMPRNTATKISTIFQDRVITELIYLLISAAMVSMMFRRLIWIHFFYHFLFICIRSFYLSLTVILTSHFSNITYFRQQQQQSKPMKYYEILPTHTETPRNTTLKIANLYIEVNYHFLTLQKKIPLLLNRSVQRNKYDLQAKMYQTIFTHHKLHNNNESKSWFPQIVYAVSDRIWCNKHLRHTTTEKYDNDG